MDRTIKRRATSAGTLVGIAAAAAVTTSCLSRPVVSNPPELQTNVSYAQQNTQIDKVDILFDIDNSSSMGDKQAFLEQAIPDLIGRLIQPNCIPAAGGVPYPSTASASAPPACNGNDQTEFPAVHNLHVGVVSSSLGDRGGDVCDPTVSPYGPRDDDQGHLLGPGISGWTGTAKETPSNFLAWFPGWPANSGITSPDSPVETDPTQFQTDFADVIGAIGVNGCGIESQLESWYRFLIQPDPYQSIVVTGADPTKNDNGTATWSDAIDTTILTERAAFLRPDSLVAIIVLTDEDDSEIDARSYGGTGFQFMLSDSLGNCNTGSDFCPCEASPGCASDPTGAGCTVPCTSSYTQIDDWGYDVNLRHVHMPQKYGFDPQYPISRYVTGLSSTTVPDRTTEYPAGGTGLYGSNATETPKLNCTNPLYATGLINPGNTSMTSSADHAALCNQTPGTRTPDMIFYAIIGGVPYQDLHYPQVGANGTVDWSTYALTTDDWTWIVGNNPEGFDYSGIDPHMIEDFAPRQNPTFPVKPGTAPPSADTGALATLGATTATIASGWDPINGREWITNGTVDDAGQVAIHGVNGLPVDRQYACIFKLPTPHDCTLTANKAAGCDCQAAAGTLTPAQTPPVCDETTVTTQDYAKAYPTIRELLVAKDLANAPGANPGIVSSICPQDVEDNDAGTDPYYGYRPAMGAILNKLSSKLSNTCIPPLQADSNGEVPCLLLAVLAAPAAPGDNCGATGLSGPNSSDQGIFTTFIADNKLPSDAIVCEVAQTPVAPGAPSCKNSSTPGWCYVSAADAGAGTCQQEIDISNVLTSAALRNATVHYQCIQTFGDGGS